jgi:hypothetical protein
VKDLIKNYEMWNEPNNLSFWQGTEAQIYQMVAPAIGIIKANVPNAVIMSMASTAEVSYTQQWLQYEQTYGASANPPEVSDVVVWHQYLNSKAIEIAPEDSSVSQILNNFISAAATSPTGAKPWRLTETSWQAYQNPYNCNGNGTSSFSAADCLGQMVRWQLIILSNGGEGLDWYVWNVNIGSQPQYAQAWASMMNYMVGATFSAPCKPISSGSSTWTCPILRADRTTLASWVWTTNAAGDTYNPSAGSGYVDYLDLTGAKTTVSAGQSISISVMPIMLEQ